MRSTPPLLLCGCLLLAFTGIVDAADPPPKQPTVVEPDAPSDDKPQADGAPVFQKTEDPKEAVKPDAPPAITKPDGTPAATGEKPAPVKVKETQPVGGNTAPPADKPELSAPVPPPEIVPKPPVRYFAIIFGSESVPKRGKYSHTWYTIVKATPKDNLTTTYDPQGNQIHYYDLLAHTISWLPSSLNIRVLKFRPDCGVNLALHPTIRYCRGQGECIAMWGPYEVNPLVAEELYDKSVQQIARLNSGRVMYKAVDPDGVTNICNCIHAVTDLDGPGRRSRYDEMQRYGFDASVYLTGVMARSNRLDTSVTHQWVAEALDLNQYRIQRRTVAPARRPAAAQPTMQTASKP